MVAEPALAESAAQEEHPGMEEAPRQPGTEPTRWLELRIHGVHGATPQSMLGVPTVRQYAGDRLTGFYRAEPGQPLPARHDEVVVESYSWGGLTSGVQGLLGQVKRALWLLLLPFALANLAYWARIHVGEDTPQGRFGQVVVRLSALVLTAFFTLSVCFVGIDLVGWQCFRAGVPACSRLPGWLDVLAELRPGQRLAIGAVLPIAAVLVLFWLTGTTTRRYEEVQETTPSAGGSDLLLTRSALWDGGARTRAMRSTHVATAFALTCAVTAAHAARMGFVSGHPGTGRVFALLGVAAGLLLLATAVVACRRLAGDDSLPEGSPGWVGGPAWASRVMAASAALLLLDLVALVVEGAGAYDEYRDFTWHDEEFVLVFVALTVLHLCLFTSDRMSTERWGGWWFLFWPIVTSVVLVLAAGVTVWHRGPDLYSAPVFAVILLVLVLGVGLSSWHFRFARAANRHRAWNGAGASVFLAAAAWIALLFTTAAVTATANYLNGDASPAQLSTSAEPFRGTTYDPSGLDRITVQGPVTLTRYDGPAAAAELTARDAWITPLPPEPRAHPCPTWLPDVLRCSDPPRPAFFHVAPGARQGPTQVTFPAGTTVVTRPSASGPGSSQIITTSQKTTVGPFRLVLTDSQHTSLVLPPVLVWSPIAQMLWMLAAAGTLLFCWLRFSSKVAVAIRDRRPDQRAERDLFTSTNHSATPGAPVTWVVPADQVEATNATRVSGAFFHRGEQLLNYTGAITAPIALLLVGLSSTNDLVNAGFPTLYGAANVSLYFVYALSLALLALGSKVRADEGVAKTAGIVWDLTTFWPRAAHPLSPPCYAERVVPEVLTRIAWARDHGYGVVVSAHSQGSLISVAALSRRTDLSGIRFVSYGSQIRALYGRAFPGVFGRDAVGYVDTEGPILLGDPFPDLPGDGTAGLTPPPADSLKERLGDRWVNLFRRGDPLGYRVFSDVVDDAEDRVVLEPVARTEGDPGSVASLGHSYYFHTPEYRALVAAWTGCGFVAPTSEPELVEPLPAS